MALSKKPYKGTRDFFPPLQRIQNYMFSQMEKTAHSFGYEPYNGPLIEEVALYKAKSGEELINDQIYSFTDRGERFVAIRPEMTPTLARMIASIHREESKPIRWFSIPNLMRYEKPQKGRLREHWQFNCDIFGAPERTGELEIIQVIIELLEGFGANHEHFEVLLNDRHLVDLVFEKLVEADKEQTHRLYKIVDKSKKVSSEALDKMISEVGLTTQGHAIFQEYLKLGNFRDVESFLKKHKAPALESLEHFIKNVEDLNLNQYIVFDPTIVRGLDYYTGLVFEVFDKHPDNRRAICGGGAYATLLKIFNEEPVPGVGFGLGDVTLKDFLITHNLLPNLELPCFDLLNTFQSDTALVANLSLARDLRKHGLSVLNQPSPLKMKKAFGLASKKGISLMTLMGDDEVEKGEVQIKNLETKEQVNLKVTDITAIISTIERMQETL
jgi:histidyl-tRNA synthetase